MKQYIHIFVNVWLLGALMFVTVPAGAADTGSDHDKDIDKQAVAILQKATGHLMKIDRFRFKADISLDVVQESGQKLQFGKTAEVTIRRPDRMYGVRVRDDGRRLQFWYDGKTVTLYEESENVYGRIPVPDTIDGMLDYLETIIQTPHPLADLLYSDLSFLLDLPESGIYAGTSIVGGLACDHLAFRNETVDWQIWVERGKHPLIRKVVITYKTLPGQPQFSAYLEQWDVAPTINDSLFRFISPKGAEEIQILSGPRGGMDKGEVKK
jgi:hypothetical protein